MNNDKGILVTLGTKMNNDKGIWVTLGSNFNLSDSLVLGEIMYDIYLNGFSEKTDKEISEKINKSLSIVKKSINKLKKEKIIKTEVERIGISKPKRFITPELYTNESTWVFNL